jgi:hypothetical protein
LIDREVRWKYLHNVVRKSLLSTEHLAKRNQIIK